VSKVVLDANVLVGWLDEHDALHVRASELADRLEAEGHALASLDFLVAEAVSVIARRSAQRRQQPPDIASALEAIRQWQQEGFIAYRPITPSEFLDSLTLVEQSRGVLNFNDARLVVMQQRGEIGDVASFDADFDGVDGFRRLS
jgi:predicted nucleic acid-binding protein